MVDPVKLVPLKLNVIDIPDTSLKLRPNDNIHQSDKSQSIQNPSVKYTVHTQKSPSLQITQPSYVFPSLETSPSLQTSPSFKTSHKHVPSKLLPIRLVSSPSALYFTSEESLIDQKLSSNSNIYSTSISQPNPSSDSNSQKNIYNREAQRKHNEKIKPFKKLSKCKTPIDLIYETLLIAHPEYQHIPKYKFYQELDSFFSRIDIILHST